MKKIIYILIITISVLTLLSACKSQPAATPAYNPSAIASPTALPSGGGWPREPGAGDSTQLDAAITAIKNAEMTITNYGNYASTINKISEDLKPILKNYDIYVHNITINELIAWDGYDDNGQFIGGTFYTVTITLAAGSSMQSVDINMNEGA